MVGMVIFTALLGIIIDAQFSFPLQLPAPLVVSMLLLGIASIQFKKQENEKCAKLYHSTIYYKVIALGIFAVLSLFSYRWEQSEKAWLRAKVYESRLNFKKLIAEAKQSQSWLPWRHEAKFFVAFGMQHTDRHESAVEVYKQLFEYFPHSSSALLRIGQSAMFDKQFDVARHYLEILIQQRPYSADANKHMGLLYFNFLNDKVKGANYFKKALQLDPTISQQEQLRRLVKKYASGSGG